MRIRYLILVFGFLIACSISRKKIQDDKCPRYHDLLKNHWYQIDDYLYGLKPMEGIENPIYKDEAYIKDECFIGLELNKIKKLLGTPSKSIIVGDSGTLIYCLDRTCLKDFKSGDKYLIMNYEENKLTSIRLNYHPIIDESK